MKIIKPLILVFGFIFVMTSCSKEELEAPSEQQSEMSRDFDKGSPFFENEERGITTAAMSGGDGSTDDNIDIPINDDGDDEDEGINPDKD